MKVFELLEILKTMPQDEEVLTERDGTPSVVKRAGGVPFAGPVCNIRYVNGLDCCHHLVKGILIT